MNQSLGERILWARRQRHMTLEDVSRQSGCSVSYISKLEAGTENPTLQVLTLVAGALGVTPAFLLEEGPEPEDLPAEFSAYLRSLPADQLGALAGGDVETRAATVIRWLCVRYPRRFTPVMLAYRLNISLETLRAILDGGCDIAGLVLNRLIRLTGIDLAFFAWGTLPDQCPTDASFRDLLPYAGPVRMARAAGIQPGRVQLAVEFLVKMKENQAFACQSI